MPKSKKKATKDKTALPVWAQIHISMIEACADGFRRVLPTLWDGEEELEFFIMQHKGSRKVGYSIRWGGSRWHYMIMGPSTMEIFDLDGLNKADCQPQFEDDPEALGRFLIEATKSWLETGDPLHFHCMACEEEAKDA